VIDDLDVSLPPERIERVPTTTLDMYLADNPPVGRLALIKIDVEGFELRALQGSVATIRRHRPAFVVENNDPEGLEAFFHDAGYRICGFNPMSRELRAQTSRAATGNNIIAIPDLAEAQGRLSRHAAHD